MENLEAPYAQINGFMRQRMVALAHAAGFDSVVVVSGGDCVSSSSVLGLAPQYGGAMEHCSCHYCECPMGLYHDHAKAKDALPRDTRGIKELGHALGLHDPTEFVPYTCRGCNQRFETVESQIEFGTPSEPDLIAEYTRLHFGVYPGKGPLLHGVEPMWFIICVLHMRLSLVKTWWKKAISEELKGAPSYSKVKILNEILQKEVFTWKQTSPAREGSIDEQGFNDKNFNGAESAHVYAYAAKLVDAVTTSAPVTAVPEASRILRARAEER